MRGVGNVPLAQGLLIFIKKLKCFQIICNTIRQQRLDNELKIGFNQILEEIFKSDQISVG